MKKIWESKQFTTAQGAIDYSNENDLVPVLYLERYFALEEETVEDMIDQDLFFYFLVFHHANDPEKLEIELIRSK